MTLNEINTTSYRIIWSVTTACLVVIALMVAMLAFGWAPDDKQKWVLMGIAGSLLTMMGFDVAQFIGKRFTDIDFASAKSAKVNVEAPATVVAAADSAVVTRPAAEEDISATDALTAAAALNVAPRGMPVGMHVPGEGD